MTSSEKASLKVVIIRLILLAGLIQFNTRRKLFVITLAIVDKNILFIAKLLIISLRKNMYQESNHIVGVYKIQDQSRILQISME